DVAARTAVQCYLRTDPTHDQAARVAEMESVLEAIAAASKVSDYAVDVRIVVCLHTSLPDEINAATLELALRRRDIVRGLDVAGPERPMIERLDHFVELYRRATDAFLPTTAHLGETSPEFIHPEMFPY